MLDSKLLSSKSLELEQGILGSIFVNPDCIYSVLDLISPTDFYHQKHTVILNAMLDCLELYGTIDLLTVVNRLKEKGELTNAGGLAYISDIATEAFTSANVLSYAQIVKKYSQLRKIIKWLYELINSITEDTQPNELFAKITKELIDLKIEKDSNNDIQSILSDLRSRWYAIQNKKEIYIPMSPLFSSLIPYYCPGHIIAIAGYTSQGKSTLLTQLMKDALDNNARVLGFSLEDSKQDKVIKFIANLTDISQRRLLTADFSYEEISPAIETIKKWPIYIYDDVYTVDDICLKIKKHKLQNRIDIVFIDYIQNLQGDGTQYENLSRAISILQKLTKELKFTLVFISQITNESLKSNSELLGLKGAGELAAAPDIIIWLKRVKGAGKERLLDCEVRKNRPFGNTGIVPLLFSQNYSRILKREV